MNSKCPIWKTSANIESFEYASGSLGPHLVSGYHVQSPRTGGNYSIEKKAYDEVGATHFDNFAKARLTTWLVNQRLMGIESPKITIEIANYAKNGSPMSVYFRADRLLRYIANLSPLLGYTFYYYPNFEVESSGHDDQIAMLAESESTEKSELVYLFNFLESRGLLIQESSSHDRLCFIVTPSGHAHLAELNAKKVDSSQGFVAMWFHESTENTYSDGIEKAIRESGYRPLRIDNKDHNNKIDDEIIAEIRRSRFLVADFTQGSEGARGGVYYEAGFSHGIGIPVIFTCHADSLEKTHFDTRQYNHIVWNTVDELKIKLKQRISATLGDGPFS